MKLNLETTITLISKLPNPYEEDSAEFISYEDLSKVCKPKKSIRMSELHSAFNCPLMVYESGFEILLKDGHIEIQDSLI